MQDRPVEQVDAVVIGANIRGLVATYVLNSLGYRAVLLERSPRVGGADGSFVTDQGTQFDFGMHVLDDMRSELATRLFTQAVDGRVVKTRLQRGIVLRGHLMPYAPEADQMPPPLRRLLPEGRLTDDLADGVPSREALREYYGSFADLVFDEVLPSFRTEHRHLAFGVDESELMTNIYPWFFPRARRSPKSNDSSRAFHDRLREGLPQDVLYPQEGGFGGFAAGFVSKFDPERIEVLTGVDVDLNVDATTHRVSWIDAGDRRFVAKKVFWAGTWPSLCSALHIECQNPATDRVLLGSFRLREAVKTPFHEILVGDPSLRINRIYFPGEFRGEDRSLLQIEYSFPVDEADWSLDPSYWQRVWTEDLTRLGLVDRANSVEEFDFRNFVMHFNSYGMEGEALVDASPEKIATQSNVFPLIPSMSNLNLNSHVPRTVRYVSSVLAEVTPDALDTPRFTGATSA